MLEKPRRMLHNQKLAMLILGLAPILSVIAALLFAWAIMVFPATLAITLCAWGILVVYWILKHRRT